MRTRATPNILGRRLAGQRLIGKGFAKAIDAVRELCAVQSQDYFGGKWALSQRIDGAGAADSAIEAAFNQGAFLRTHVLRPTWHFVAPEDIRWMHALTGSRVNAIMGRYDHAFGLSPAVYRRSQDLFAKALAGNRHLTRDELKEVLERGKIRVMNGEALARIVMHAEQGAVITSGPRRGKQFTYALLEERVKPAPVTDRDEALGELMRRYFKTRGPATVADGAWWSGLTQADVKRGIQVVGRSLRREEIDGREYWSAERTGLRKTPSVHLLPNYDEYFIGFKDRSAIGHRIGGVKRVTGGNALIAHVVCVDGELVGGWKRQGDRATLDIVAQLSAAEKKRVAKAVQRHAAFLSS